jgi:hypothetical protein
MFERLKEFEKCIFFHESAEIIQQIYWEREGRGSRRCRARGVGIFPGAPRWCETDKVIG